MKSTGISRCLVFAFLVLAAAYVSGQEGGQIPERPDMVLVEGGSFVMGEEGGKYNPAHTVILSSFYMARYEVTLGLWKRFTREALPEFEWDYMEFRGLGRIGEVKENDPRAAYYMNWYEAVRFCNWLSEKHGLKPVYTLHKYQKLEWGRGSRQWLRPEVEWDRSADGYRLPTEAEWEYAARGGRHSKGYIYAGSNDLDEVGWYWIDIKTDRGVHPVGEKKPNELGLYDMSGNVAEFCWDFYDITYYPRSPEKDPAGPDRGFYPAKLVEQSDINPDDIPYQRSLRGGSSSHEQEWCRTRVRLTARDHQRYLFGIRLVRNTPEG
jgi:sulfatase modifying factor 1